jgi:hypothetical protein
MALPATTPQAQNENQPSALARRLLGPLEDRRLLAIDFVDIIPTSPIWAIEWNIRWTSERRGRRGGNETETCMPPANLAAC